MGRENPSDFAAGKKRQNESEPAKRSGTLSIWARTFLSGISVPTLQAVYFSSLIVPFCINEYAAVLTLKAPIITGSASVDLAAGRARIGIALRVVSVAGFYGIGLYDHAGRIDGPI